MPKAGRVSELAIWFFVEDDGDGPAILNNVVHKLDIGGIPVTARVWRSVQNAKAASNQRNKVTPLGEGMEIDGQLFSGHLPKRLRLLPMPPIGATVLEKAKFIEKSDERALWAYGRHKAPGADGVTRWKCPFCLGKIKTRVLPKSLRKAKRTAPLVSVAKRRSTNGCDGVMSVSADSLPLQQLTIFGITAWWASWGRRSIVESVNAALKGMFTDISKGYVKLMTTSKISLMLAHTIAGYNRWALRSWNQLNGRELTSRRLQTMRSGSAARTQ